MESPKIAIIYGRKVVWNNHPSIILNVDVGREYILGSFSPIVPTILTNILNMDKETKPQIHTKGANNT